MALHLCDLLLDIFLVLMCLFYVPFYLLTCSFPSLLPFCGALPLLLVAILLTLRLSYVALLFSL